MLHPFDKEQKVSIPLAALTERYNAQHIIRERVQSMGVWALGLLLAAGGWIIQSGVELSCTKRILFIIGIVIAFVALRFRYLGDLEVGFKSQQQRAARIEKALGLFTPSTFDDEAEGVYPEKLAHAGTGNGGGKFFETTYILLYIGIAFLILSILFSGTKHNVQHRMHHIEMQYISSDQLEDIFR